MGTNPVGILDVFEFSAVDRAEHGGRVGGRAHLIRGMCLHLTAAEVEPVPRSLRHSGFRNRRLHRLPHRGFVELRRRGVDEVRSICRFWRACGNRLSQKIFGRAFFLAVQQP